MSKDLSVICGDLLDAIGENRNRDGLKETPGRFEKAMEENFSGYMYNENYLPSLFKMFDSPNDSMVIQTGIPVRSWCEHHIMPFYGTCNIGYIPDGKVIGASKLTRIVDYFSRTLSIQETLTEDIAKALQAKLQCKGIMITMRCIHLCMAYRGVKTLNTPMITSTVIGLFKEDRAVRSEFLQLSQDIPSLM